MRTPEIRPAQVRYRIVVASKTEFRSFNDPRTKALQYHFTDFGAFRPYVGAGVNYTIFYDQSGKSARSLDVKNAFGVALQAGFDYMLDEHWGLNVDAKKIFLRPDFDANVGGAHVSGKANLDPWLIGAGVTYRF